MMRGRMLAFVGLCLVCALAAGAYVRHAIRRAEQAGSAGETVAANGDRGLRPSGTTVLFRSTAIDSSYGRLALAPIEDPSRRQLVPTLSCERVDFASGRGVCLTAARGVVTTYAAVVFDQDFQPLFTLALAGAPSRVRVSADGAFAAVTVFVSGHSYGGDFSTVTSIIDLHRGDYVVPNLEQFTVWNEAERFDAVDRNFWGVTFARNPDTFYATVGSSGRTYLIKGAAGEREARIMRDGVECPSLSPDNRRVAFKRRDGNAVGPVRWRLSVLDLDSLRDVGLAETRNVDDQVAWLDNDRVMYTLPNAESGTAETTTWVVPANGGGEPAVLVPLASSTVVWSP